MVRGKWTVPHSSAFTAGQLRWQQEAAGAGSHRLPQTGTEVSTVTVHITALLPVFPALLRIAQSCLADCGRFAANPSSAFCLAALTAKRISIVDHRVRTASALLPAMQRPRC